jgi:hypothetical protein
LNDPGFVSKFKDAGGNYLLAPTGDDTKKLPYTPID